MNKFDEFNTLFQQQIDTLSRKIESQGLTSQRKPLPQPAPSSGHVEGSESSRVIHEDPSNLPRPNLSFSAIENQATTPQAIGDPCG